MNIDLGSFAFGSIVKSGGGTCSWGTAFGQSSPAYKYTYPGFESIVIGMMYCSAPKSFFSMPLGKGGHIYKCDEDDTIQLTSIFHNVFVNEKKIDYPFLMAIVKEESTSHFGRRSLKYSDKISYDDGNKQYSNGNFVSAVCDVFGMVDDACWFVYAIDIKNQDELHLKVVVVDAENSCEYVDSAHRKSHWLELIPASDYINNGGDEVSRNGCFTDEFPLQTIYYGAPGTGKSYRIDGHTNDDNSIRTTFHPDTDYATFVGAYKPMMDVVDEYALDATGKTHQVVYPNSKKSIVYDFEPQVFLKAYVEAWKRYLNKQEGEDDSYYLVIEEINRGNCAQIFGDLFQLLDREDNGYSSYAISPESSITKYLSEEAQSADGTKFSDLGFSDVTKYRDGAEKVVATADDLKAGKRLVLPPNLHIWATMNTSDQSLFPIDSAFKRRWDWKYVPIKRADNEPENKWIIKVTHDGKTYWCYWWEFLEAINHQIEETTHSEDKQLGYFFAKPKAGENFISTDTFVNKVIFYLWNDVFKDEDSAVFQYDNNKVEDISINRSGAMYFRHFMENKDEMIHYFINQLFAMGKDSTPVVPIDYLKNDANSNVIEHLPKMREGDPVKLDDEAVDEETSEDNGISVRKSDNIDKIVFLIPEYKKMSEKLAQALKGNVFKYSKNSMDMKMGDMPISYARLSMAYSSKKTDIKLYIPSKSVYNQSIECYKYMNSKGVEDIIAEVSERNNLEYELISKDIAENKVLGWRIKYPMTFSESGDNIMDGDVTKIVEIVKELQKRITPIMNEFSKNGK